ncbi:MAG: uracil-DNA glycosylase family protein [Chthoniobacteraceae bacterium]
MAQDNATAMSQFDEALNYVHRALSDLREGGTADHLRSSFTALEQLKATARPAASKATPMAVASPTLRPPSPQPLEPATPTVPQPSMPAKTPALTSTVSSPRITQPGAPKAERIQALREVALQCVKCPHLVKSRTQVVFGVGNIDARLMFVGEAPGEDEDLQGEPFVGRAGQLLTKIIEAMGLTRADVYIGNVLKCRPDMPPGVSGNRKPKLDEMKTCLPYLEEQIEIIQPKALVALGATAMEGLINETSPMNRLRGRWHEFNGIPLMATYHPAYLLRNQSLSEKRKVWEDMLMVMEKLEMPISTKQRIFFLPKE